MCCKILVYGSDARQQSLVANLPGIRKKDTCMNPRVVILPTPLSGKNIADPFWLNVSQRIKETHPIVFAGKIDGKWQEFLDTNQIRYIDLLQDQKLVEDNAKLTAEATLGIILTQGAYCIENEKYMVAGYGRCGRAIVQKIMALGGKVTVLARNAEVRKQVRAEGGEAVPFAYGPKEAYSCRALINTVPQRVIGEPIINNLADDCLVVDIASTSGCDVDVIGKRGMTYIHALGLPARYMTQTSGRIMAECLMRYLRSQHNIIEEMPWIYQIKE